MRFLAVLPLLASMGAPVAPPAVAAVVSPPETSGATTRTDLVAALEVLHDWDARRALAWAHDDPEALRALYVRGSAAGRADVHLLRAYRARGLVVSRLVTQVFAVRVLYSKPVAVQLRVFDRVAGGDVLDHGDIVPLHSSRPATRTISFRRDAGKWRVSEVSGSGRDPRAARP